MPLSGSAATDFAPTCTLPDAAIKIYQVEGANPGPVDEALSVSAADTAA